MVKAKQSPTPGFDDPRLSFVKGLKHKTPGIVDPAAFTQFSSAFGAFDPVAKVFSGGTPGNLEVAPAGLSSILGLGRLLNNPLASFAKSIAGGDPDTFGGTIVPPAPAFWSLDYQVELLELYWASLLRDVPFTEYSSNPVAKAAAAELTQHKANYAGPRSANDKIAPELLFRGGGKRFGPGKNKKWFDGEELGPYLSQFCLIPTQFGSMPISQKVNVYPAGRDYMTDFGNWYAVQQGLVTDEPIATSTRHLTDGRSLSSYTRVDELYQAYFVAYLVLKTLKMPVNIGLPYAADNLARLKVQKSFGTFGDADIAATLAAVAKVALNVVWYQKWMVHRRHRPEVAGGIVHMVDTKYSPDGGLPTFPPGFLPNDFVLASSALAQSKQKWGSYLLSQAFPEGSPAHPAYPTGHGTVAGACITVLKFFFKGEAILPRAVEPLPDGSGLKDYSGQLTVNGELHKLAHNISFGHGIHGGIHWRSDTDYSIALGEEVAIRFLRAVKAEYAEPTSHVDFKKIDGTTVSPAI